MELKNYECVFYNILNVRRLTLEIMIFLILFFQFAQISFQFDKVVNFKRQLECL